MVYKLPVLSSFLTVKFPIYLTDRYPLKDFEGISIENYVKRLHFDNIQWAVPIAYDFISEISSTYLGRLTSLSKVDIKPLIKFDFSFVDLAHFIYAKPKNLLHKQAIIVDDFGSLHTAGKIEAQIRYAKTLEIQGQYLKVMGYPCPIRLPDNPLVIEAIAEYKPIIELVQIYNTWFFHNIHDKYQQDLMKSRTMRLL